MAPLRARIYNNKTKERWISTLFLMAHHRARIYNNKIKERWISTLFLMAPQVGLEPTTTRLTAECSAIELLRNIGLRKAHAFRNLMLGSGGDLLSRAVSSQVPSALKGLTSVFGMGTGVTPSPLPPEILRVALAYFRTPSHPHNCT